jgi:hypothetical protein
VFEILTIHGSRAAVWCVGWFSSINGGFHVAWYEHKKDTVIMKYVTQNILYLYKLEG